MTVECAPCSQWPMGAVSGFFIRFVLRISVACARAPKHSRVT